MACSPPSFHELIQGPARGTVRDARLHRRGVAARLPQGECRTGCAPYTNTHTQFRASSVPSLADIQDAHAPRPIRRLIAHTFCVHGRDTHSAAGLGLGLGLGCAGLLAALRWHPDVAGTLGADTKYAEKMFKTMVEAYETIKDQRARPGQPNISPNIQLQVHLFYRRKIQCLVQRVYVCHTPRSERAASSTFEDAFEKKLDVFLSWPGGRSPRRRQW